jgi:hypothetical protein
MSDQISSSGEPELNEEQIRQILILETDYQGAADAVSEIYNISPCIVYKIWYLKIKQIDIDQIRKIERDQLRLEICKLQLEICQHRLKLESSQA